MKVLFGDSFIKDFLALLLMFVAYILGSRGVRIYYVVALILLSYGFIGGVEVLLQKERNFRKLLLYVMLSIIASVILLFGIHYYYEGTSMYYSIIPAVAGFVLLIAVIRAKVIDWK